MRGSSPAASLNTASLMLAALLAMVSTWTSMLLIYVVKAGSLTAIISAAVGVASIAEGSEVTTVPMPEV